MKSMLLYLLMLGLYILGARLPNNYIAIIAILYSAVLVYFLVKEKLSWPKFFLFCFGLGLLYQTTLVSNYLIGTDIHGEYYYAWLTLNNGWDPSRYAEYNMALGSTLVPPLISWVTGLDLYVIFKWIMPVFLALVPPLLYLLFNRYFNKRVSLLSCLFFIIMPAFSMEVSGIVKEMIGELFLVLTLFVLLSTWKLKLKIPLLVLCTILTVILHYSMGIILIIFLSVMLLIYLIKGPKTQTLLTALALVIVLSTCFFWFTNVSKGRLINVLYIQGQWQVQRVLNLVSIPYSVSTKTLDINSKVEETNSQHQTQTYIDNQQLQLSDNLTYFDKQETSLRSALGADLLTSNLDGFIFRVLQYSTQVLIIIGALYVLINYKRFNKYLPLFFAGGSLLAATVLLPNFSSLMNASRLYHLSLLAISPLLVIGISTLSKKYLTNLYLILIIPYFLFCSGFIYEIEQSTTIDKLTIPYSKGISGERSNLVGVFTDNDIKVRDYAYSENLSPIYSDFNGTVLLIEKMGDIPFYLEINSKQSSVDKSYLYLTERASTNGLISWKNIGSRRPLELYPGTLNNRNIVFQKGDAKIYGPKE